MKEKILIIDDEQGILDWLQLVLTKSGYEVKTTSAVATGLEIFKEEHFDLALLDIRMEPLNGIEILERMKIIDPEAVVIMMTAYASVETAVEAMRRGAYDYISKPFRLEEIKNMIVKALSQKRLIADTPALQKKLRARYKFENIVGHSPAMQVVFKTVEKIARTNTTILISGESGTGKELIARAIHYNSLRVKKPFVSIDCGALPEELLESELFGHVKGSFTGAITTKEGLFEVADGGTLFLDEVGELSAAIQVKLLRTLQEREIRRVGATSNIKVDVRIIAATNRDLDDDVKRERFRKDLFYRLSVIPLHLPALRERREDIPWLAEHFMKKFALPDKPKFCLAAAVMPLLQTYDWPGNVRELENVIERAMALAEGEVISAEILPDKIKYRGAKLKDETTGVTLKEKVADFEKNLILQTLKTCNGNQNKAAKLLGLARQDIHYKLKKYNINSNDLS